VRWYSEQPAAAKAGEAADSKAAEQSSQASSDAALKEQLEKKDKEIIDLKASSVPSAAHRIASHPATHLQDAALLLKHASTNVQQQDKYLRSVADFRNLQERTKREVQAAKDFALQRFAKDLVDSVDNLDRALTTVPPEKLKSDNNDLVTLHDGIKMTETILMQTLKKHGLERVDPSEAMEKFDPNKHEAVFMAPQPDKEDGVVFHTQQKGFTLNGRVLRAAKVGVVKNA
jgi:molecular chaperone GrpE